MYLYSLQMLEIPWLCFKILTWFLALSDVHLCSMCSQLYSFWSAHYSSSLLVHLSCFAVLPLSESSPLKGESPVLLFSWTHFLASCCWCFLSLSLFLSLYASVLQLALEFWMLYFLANHCFLEICCNLKDDVYAYQNKACGRSILVENNLKE